MTYLAEPRAVSQAAPAAPATAPPPPDQPKIQVRDLHLWYSALPALKGIQVDIQAKEITALIGPSGCGKSSFLRCLNRMNELIPGARVSGQVLLEGANIYQRMDPAALRKRVGMVFQRPNPFPKSIFDNVAYGLRINRLVRSREELLGRVEASLRSAALWDEVKDRLHSSAIGLSGGQQQRLCIARAIAAEPEVLLMDEPCSALDPIATGKVEELMYELRGKYTVVIVTHNMQQAARVSDYTAFMYLGRLIEYGPTSEIFTRPKLKETESYVTGRFG